MKPSATKNYDFAFGYTVLKKSGREGFIGGINEIAAQFPENKTKVLIKNQYTDENTLLPKSAYLSLLKNSRYTYVLPAYDKDCFSIFRFLEAINLDCLPLIHPDCKIDDVEMSFGVQISDLTRIPKSDEWRLEKLRYLQAKMLVFQKNFARTQ